MGYSEFQLHSNSHFPPPTPTAFSASQSSPASDVVYRCVCAPLSLEVEKTSSSLHQTVTSELSVGKLELLECLFERPAASTTQSFQCSCTKLLKFTTHDNTAACIFTAKLSSSGACLKAKYRNTQRTLSPVRKLFSFFSINFVFFGGVGGFGV